ncbi:hypothetical protein [Vibrio splendidus]|uniref:hypothetical protein n=1 Tax=Vibrio splendidus TaxID=29497 RepID=UPI000C82323A|nr:hypothetical protein [Vibrio splendidus]PMN33918.1 hypothetical protein BCT36_24940 [Vibrio splendidus]
MSEETVLLFQLKELIPFYSIAFAVNMAFGFWDSLRDTHIKQFDELSKQKNESFANALKIQGSKPNECLDEFKSKVSNKKRNLEKISSMGKVGCGFMCIIMSALIAYVGMYVDTKVSFNLTIFTILGSILPFSIMMLTSYFYSKKSLSDIEKSTEDQIKGMNSVLNGVAGAYQPESQ